jgi:hypothetical protein
MSRPEDTLSFGAEEPGVEAFAQISVQLTSSILMEEVVKWSFKKAFGETTEKVAMKKLTATMVKSTSSKVQYKLGLEATKKLISSCGRNTAKLQAQFLAKMSEQPKMLGQVARGFEAIKKAVYSGITAIEAEKQLAEIADYESKITNNANDAARSIKEAEDAVKQAKNADDLAKATKNLDEAKDAAKKIDDALKIAREAKNVKEAADAAEAAAKAIKSTKAATDAALDAAKASQAAIKAARAAASAIRAAKSAASVVSDIAIKMGAGCIGGPVGCAVGVVLFVFEMINLALDQIDPSGISIYISKTDIDTIAQITQQAKAQSLIDENTPPEEAYGFFDTEVTFDPTAFFFDPNIDPETGMFPINEEYFKMFDFYRDEYMKSIGVTPQWRNYIETVELPSANDPLVISAAGLLLKETTDLQVQGYNPPSPTKPPKSDNTTVILVIFVIIFIFILMFTLIK